MLVFAIIGDHIRSVTPRRTSTIVTRILVALVFGAAALMAVTALPGQGTQACKRCESSLLSLLLLNHGQIYAIGAMAGYIGVMISLLKHKRA